MYRSKRCLNLSTINKKLWRNQYGAVLQDGHIFSETIIRNIAIGEEKPDKLRLLHAANVANIQSFIDKLPLGYSTIIGQDGKDPKQNQERSC